MQKFPTKLGSTCTAAYGVQTWWWWYGPTGTHAHDASVVSCHQQRFQSHNAAIICGGKGRAGQAGSERNGWEAAQKGKQKGVRNRERIQFQPRLPPSCSIPSPPGNCKAALLACFASLLSSLPRARRAEAQAGGGGIAAGQRMSDRELRQLRSIRITGDGRCMFRSVAYGACLRRGKQSPSESSQKELADELRAKVADEFVKRRGDTEWFLEGDFDRYVSRMRKPHVWGGEPELLMCSHVLRMPITVYMHTNSSDSPRIIAEYGQEYGKDDPVRVLYDGYGHYDALQPSLIPLSSANEDLQPVLSAQRRIIALNKKDLANQNILNRWLHHFESCKQDCISINEHSKSSVTQLLGFAELKLKEAILKEPTLLIMVVGVPNVGKSALINSIHRIATSRFPVHDKKKRATVGPLPGVTQDIAGYKIASQPSIYVLDTPGVLVPSITDMEAGLKLALAGAVKDSIVGEERIAKYLLSLLNIRKTPLHWERLLHGREEFHDESSSSNEKDFRDSIRRRRRLNNSDALYVQDLVTEVQRSLCSTFLDFTGNIDEESELESLIDMQLTALRKVFRIPHKPFDETHGPTSKKLLTLFRSGKLGPFILDDLPDEH